ncbi:hypothetical protein EBU99_02415 [bacterium]|nr:hypothetical protein [bacterium]
MLQYTLARDSLLVGFGSARATDVSPLATHPQSKPGARPSLFFAPTRDANGLLVRKSFTHLLLVRRVQVDGLSRAILLPLPANEWVADTQLESLLPADHPVTVATCVARSSQLHPQSDIASAEFSFEHPEFKAPISLQIESFVHENSLREQFVLDKFSGEFACFVVHWHQPEMGGSELFQTTYACLNAGALVSYRAGQFFSARVSQNNANLIPAYANCVQIQAGHCAIRDFSCQLSKLLTTIKQLGSGAPLAVRAQVLKRWQTVQSEPIATGTSQGIMVWPVDAHQPIELSQGWSKSLEAAVARSASPHSSARAVVMSADEAWLLKVGERKSVDLPEPVRGLYERSLLTLKQMQDPSGGIIAAPEFQFEFTACGGYGYCWGRDAGFISLAMDTAGMFDESEHFYRYMAQCQAENGSFLHRHDMHGNLGPSWGLLQPDETGSVLFGLWQHVKLSGRSKVASELRGMVERAAHWLSSCRFEDTDWIAEGFDLWEEREGVHLYSVAAAIAGLRAASDLAEKLNWKTGEQWRERAAVLAKMLEENLVASQTAGESSFARTLFLKNTSEQSALQHSSASSLEDSSIAAKRWLSDYVVDISLLGVVEPFEALAPAFANKILPSLCHAMRKHLWRKGVGGIGRYEGDHYRDGQPWILTTLWLALAAARCNENDLAVECLSWVLKHTPREGQLPEQVDPVTGEPAWVMPLTWSHAMFVLACWQIPKNIWQQVVSSQSSFLKNNPI